MAPAVRDGDQWLVESGAILEALLNRYIDTAAPPGVRRKVSASTILRTKTS